MSWLHAGAYVWLVGGVVVIGGLGYGETRRQRAAQHARADELRIKRAVFEATYREPEHE